MRKMNLLSVGTNAKTVKGDGDGKLTAIMYLAPSTTSGYDTCPAASEGCRKVCLYTSGRGAMGNVQQARIRKTKLLFERKQEFLELLDKDLATFSQHCKDVEVKGFVRLNGTSDIDYSTLPVRDGKNVFELYPDLQFYDYTKDFSRTVKHDNYYLLYSRSEDTPDSTVKSRLDAGDNVAVVFDEVPKTWNGYTVIDGDESDLRPIDPRGVVVGLKAKGLARKQDSNGFVVKIDIKNID